LNSGLVPGVKKCTWQPVKVIDWNGLTFNFQTKTLSIMNRRIIKTEQSITETIAHWPDVTYRTVSRVVGRLNSMKPVLKGTEQLKTKMLQTFINIRNFQNLNWDDKIHSNYDPLYQLGLHELIFWQELLHVPFSRDFNEPSPNVVAWTDASNSAVAGFAAVFSKQVNNVPCTANNLLSYDRHRLEEGNCAQLQVGPLPRLGVPEFVHNLKHELNASQVAETYLVHRNLEYFERAEDSNERELIAVVHLLKQCGARLAGSVLTIHLDNQNAVIICTKGSNKPRLQRYALEIYEICAKFRILLHAVWIPRDLNQYADFYSKLVDYEDYSVTKDFFRRVCDDFGTPDVDCFANDKNATVAKFFSKVFYEHSVGVDCFKYNWSRYRMPWLFPPPDMILKTVRHLQNCNSTGLLLVPQWKHSAYYPELLCQLTNGCVIKRAVYRGKNVFASGIDKTSYFGPDYKGNVEVWHLNFTNMPLP